MSDPRYDVPNQPGEDEDTGRAPIMAVVFGVVLLAITLLVLVVAR